MKQSRMNPNITHEHVHEDEFAFQKVFARLLNQVVIFINMWFSVYFIGSGWQNEYWTLIIIYIVVFDFVSEYLNIYDVWCPSVLGKIRRLVYAWGIVSMTILSVGWALASWVTISSTVVISWLLLALVSMSLANIALYVLFSPFRRRVKNKRKVAIIGASSLGYRLQQTFFGMPWLGYELIGYYDDRYRDANKDQNIIGRINDAYSDAKKGLIDILYIVLPSKAEYRYKDILEKLEDTAIDVIIVPDLVVFHTLNTHWKFIQGIPVISVNGTQFYHLNSFIKRCEDVVLSSIIILFIAIPMIFIAIGVKLSSPGSVIFKQYRYGIKGEKIEVYKFRSMTVSDNGSNVEQAKRNDPRVTRFGAFLRQTSLDELPQFINVLQGRMSIVGPRPHAVAHNEEYRGLIQGYMLRHKVKPGITGLAQVSGFRGETDTLEKMELRVYHDLKYIKNWNMWVDIKIIFHTIFNGFVGKEAY